MRIQDDLVARQLKRWQMDRKLRERFERDEEEALRCKNVITMSREHGSGGTIVGMLVAKRLNWNFYDRELIDHVAAHMGAKTEHVEYHDEQPPRFMHNLLMQLLEGKRPTEGQYLRALIRILRRIRNEGNAVVMGRGGSLVIPDSLRVRIVAPEDIRVERKAELENLTLNQARREVASIDRQRTSFVTGHFGINSSDPQFYDLTVNTANTSLEHAADIVIAALSTRGGEACPLPPPGAGSEDNES